MITSPEANPTVQPTSSDARPHWYALLGSFAGRWMSAWPAGAPLGLAQAGGGSPALSRKSESSMGASSRDNRPLMGLGSRRAARKDRPRSADRPADARRNTPTCVA